MIWYFHLPKKKIHWAHLYQRYDFYLLNMDPPLHDKTVCAQKHSTTATVSIIPLPKLLFISPELHNDTNLSFKFIDRCSNDSWDCSCWCCFVWASIVLTDDIISFKCTLHFNTKIRSERKHFEYFACTQINWINGPFGAQCVRVITRP